MKRFINDEDITLFSPHEVPEPRHFSRCHDEFDELYKMPKEKQVSVKRKVKGKHCFLICSKKAQKP